jgi:hypothetical protein
MYDSVDTLHDCIGISTGVVSTLAIRPQRMLSGLSADMLATDLAEYLVRKGVPFRETHHISGGCRGAAGAAGSAKAGWCSCWSRRGVEEQRARGSVQRGGPAPPRMLCLEAPDSTPGFTSPPPRPFWRSSPVKPLAPAATRPPAGAAVKMAEDKGIPMSQLSVADLQSIHPLFSEPLRLPGWLAGCWLREWNGTRWLVAWCSSRCSRLPFVIMDQ